ncbi:Protein GVQW1 [Plecturocebus cupreus]
MISAHCNLQLLGSSDPPASCLSLWSSWDYKPIPLCSVIGFCHVIQICLEHLGPSDLLTLASQRAGITGMSHHTQPLNPIWSHYVAQDSLELLVSVILPPQPPNVLGLQVRTTVSSLVRKVYVQGLLASRLEWSGTISAHCTFHLRGSSLSLSSSWDYQQVYIPVRSIYSTSGMPSYPDRRNQVKCQGVFLFTRDNFSRNSSLGV